MNSRKMDRAMILYSKQKKAEFGFYIPANTTEYRRPSSSRDVTTYEREMNEIDKVLEIKYTMKDIESQLNKAMEDGKKITITYYDFPAFETITGYVERINFEARQVSVVFYQNRWDIKMYNIVELETER